MNYLICLYAGYMGIFVLNIKFLCLTWWLGEVCIDDTNTDDANDDANHEDARRTKHDCKRLFG